MIITMMRGVAAFVLALSGCRPPAPPEPPAPPVRDPVAAIEGATVEAVARGEADVPPLDPSAVDRVRDALWAKYVAEVKADPDRRADHEEHVVRVGTTQMRYAARRVGEPPYPLFIALHGGGQAAPEVNDSQWEQMQSYWFDSVDHGVYVAPRGITDDWNLHFRPESYALYDQLIRDMIVFEGVDPDRVYLMGYSAGGDGVYQIAARMPDRFAAVNMSAGHPNSVPLLNLANLPILLQAGELDDAYDRNRVTAQTCLALRDLDSPHACFIHRGRGHNFVDRDPGGTPQAVLADLAAWLERGASEVEERDTNAVHWLQQHVRQPLPSSVRLDPATAPPDRAVQRAYWVESATAEPGMTPVIARYDRATNRVRVEGGAGPIRLWLSEAMVDLSAPVSLVVGDGPPRSVVLSLEAATLARSMLDRGDPQLAFPAVVDLDPAD